MQAKKKATENRIKITRRAPLTYCSFILTLAVAINTETKKIICQPLFVRTPEERENIFFIRSRFTF
jgi:hypothetical protein